MQHSPNSMIVQAQKNYVSSFYTYADKHRPDGLTRSTLMDTDDDFQESGYMISDLFTNWLWELGWEMHRRQNIALMINNSSRHGKIY